MNMNVYRSKSRGRDRGCRRNFLNKDFGRPLSHASSVPRCLRREIVAEPGSNGSLCSSSRSKSSTEDEDRSSAKGKSPDFGIAVFSVVSIERGSVREVVVQVVVFVVVFGIQIRI